MISCLEKNFVATQKTIYSQPKEKILQEHGNILLTLKSINKLFQLKRVNILQINFNQNLANMVEVMVKFRRPQNVNNCIGIKSYFLYQKMVQLNLIHLFSPPFVPAILLMNHICRWNKSSNSINTSYLTDSYIGFTLKMESVSKNTIFGLKMMVKSGLEKIFLKFLHAGDYFSLLHKSATNHKFSNKNNYLPDFKINFSRSLFTIILGQKW